MPDSHRPPGEAQARSSSAKEISKGVENAYAGQAGLCYGHNAGTTIEEAPKSKKSVRLRADEIKPFRCKNLIAVLENPTDVKNIGTVIRNVNALGVEKAYVVDPRKHAAR